VSKLDELNDLLKEGGGDGSGAGAIGDGGTVATSGDSGYFTPTFGSTKKRKKKKDDPDTYDDFLEKNSGMEGGLSVGLSNRPLKGGGSDKVDRPEKQTINESPKDLPRAEEPDEPSPLETAQGPQPSEKSNTGPNEVLAKPKVTKIKKNTEATGFGPSLQHEFDPLKRGGELDEEGAEANKTLKRRLKKWDWDANKESWREFNLRMLRKGELLDDDS